MATTVKLKYRITFGKGDSTDWREWNITLYGEADDQYFWDKMLRLSLYNDPALKGVLSAAYKEIEEEEIANGIKSDDEYTKACQGYIPVNEEEINALVAARDPYTLEFFGLSGLSDEELDDWDASELENLPYVRDFDEDFEPESPFDGDYSLIVDFVDWPDEEILDIEEACQTLQMLFSEAKGNYELVDDYVSRCERMYDGVGSLHELAEGFALDLGLTDFVERG